MSLHFSVVVIVIVIITIIIIIIIIITFNRHKSDRQGKYKHVCLVKLILYAGVRSDH